MAYRKAFTLGDDDKDVLDYYNSIPKGLRSNYIRDLIRKDKYGEPLEEMIERIVDKRLKQNPTQSSAKNTDVFNALKGLTEQ